MYVSPFAMYVLQVLQSTSPDIGLFDIDLSSPSPVAASAPLLFGITPTPAPLVWRGALPLPLTTIEPHLNQTPVGQDCLVESTPISWPSSVSPMGQSMSRQRRPAPPGADMTANQTPVNIMAIPASHSPQVCPCLHGRGRRTPGKRTIEPGKSIIALHNAATGILI